MAAYSPLLVCICAALLPACSFADTADDAWEWRGTLYLWLPSLGGETSFPPDGGGPPIDITAEQILDALDGLFMVAVEARKGPWGVGTDLVYVDFQASKNGTRQFGLGPVDVPASVDADLDFGITGWLWSLTASHALLDSESLALNVVGGVRMLDLEENLHWTFNGDISGLPLSGRSGSAMAKDTQWDAIVGIKGRASFGTQHRWFVPYQLDVGTGESDLTWQAMAGLGYGFESIDLLGVWRYVDYDLGDSQPIKSINFSGPALGVTFRF